MASSYHPQQSERWVNTWGSTHSPLHSVNTCELTDTLHWKRLTFDSSFNFNCALFHSCPNIAPSKLDSKYFMIKLISLLGLVLHYFSSCLVVNRIIGRIVDAATEMRRKTFDGVTWVWVTVTTIKNLYDIRIQICFSSRITFLTRMVNLKHKWNHDFDRPFSQLNFNWIADSNLVIINSFLTNIHYSWRQKICKL